MDGISVAHSFCSGMLNRTLYVADDMPCLWSWQMVKSYVQLLDIIHNLFNNVPNVIPHCTKIVHIVPTLWQGCYFVQYIMYALCFPHPTSKLHVYFYQLYTYYWTYWMPGSARAYIWVMAPSSEQQVQVNITCSELVFLPIYSSLHSTLMSFKQLNSLHREPLQT